MQLKTAMRPGLKACNSLKETRRRYNKHTVKCSNIVKTYSIIILT